MQPPRLSGDAFLADVDAARAQPDRFHLWWLGQSGFLLLWQGRSLLFDPYLSDSLTRKYAGTDKPHVRLTGLVIEPSRLNFIDVVTSSHNHTDHLDADTLLPLIESNPALQLVLPEANRAFAAERLRLDDPAWLVGLDDGDTVELSGFRIHAVPAAHETLERDEQGRLKFLGYVVQFGPWRVYHAGDTVLYDGMADRLRPFAIDLAMLPINGSLPERRVAGNLWGREAAWLAREAGIAHVIPCHFDMFAFNTVTPEEFKRSAEQLGVSYTVLRNGERYSSAPRSLREG